MTAGVHSCDFKLIAPVSILFQADKGISYLAADARWPVWSASMLYEQILEVIERNNYDVFSQRAYVPQWKKLRTLPVAWMRSQVL
jgi:Phytoene/squalene synthetase